MQKIRKAEGKEVSIRPSHDQLTGKDRKLLVTPRTQIKVFKTIAKRTGVTIKFSKAAMKANAKSGGSLASLFLNGLKMVGPLLSRLAAGAVT